MNDCGGVAQDCSDLDQCVENLGAMSAACHSALDDFIECWDEHTDCSSSECVEPAMKFEAECEDEL